jgi:hypothetical protein
MESSQVTADICPSQSFGPAPDASWGVDDLGRYAQNVNLAITDGERLLTPSYWSLGLALELARRQFSYRQWGKFLTSLSVDPTRASKARAIHRTFANVEEVTDLSVKEAYQRRKRDKRPRVSSTAREFIAASAAQPTVSADEPAFNPVQFCIEICQKAELCQVVAESATPEDAADFLTAIDEAIGELAKLRTALGLKATSKRAGVGLVAG